MLSEDKTQNKKLDNLLLAAHLAHFVSFKHFIRDFRRIKTSNTNGENTPETQDRSLVFARETVCYSIHSPFLPDEAIEEKEDRNSLNYEALLSAHPLTVAYCPGCCGMLHKGGRGDSIMTLSDQTAGQRTWLRCAPRPSLCQDRVVFLRTSRNQGASGNQQMGVNVIIFGLPLPAYLCRQGRKETGKERQF